MDRLALLRSQLKEPGPTVWDEPFYEAWKAGAGLDGRVRLARAQAAEMAGARPFVKPGELIIGNNGLRSALTGLPAAFSSGLQFSDKRFQQLRDDHPEAHAKLDEIQTFWTAWHAENAPYTPMAMHASLAYEIPLTLGVDGLREQVRHWRVINAGARPACEPWYEALEITLDGVSAYIEAHAVAAEQAATEADSAQRRAELERVAAACRRVAHDPPGSFHEGVQLFYLLFMLCGHDSPGPVDRYLYPCLRADLAGGTISLDGAQELVDCLWLKFEEKTAYGATLGGQTRDGSDASNELSLLCVNAIRRLRLLSPRTALRWHPGLSDELFAAALETVADGASFPAFVNDEAIIPAMVGRGVSLADAREYTFVGCGQTFPHGRGHGNYEDVVFNSAKPLEMALHDGIDPMTGERLGPATGAPESFGSYEQFEHAYRQQMDGQIAERIEAVNARRATLVGHTHDFLRSLMVRSCVERGLDWHAGGADYSEGMVDMVGLTTVTDSLIAVKQAVFHDRLISLADLVGCLDSDWEGAEALRQTLLKRVPKFGNDLAEADRFTADEVARINNVIKSHRTVFGGPWGMDIIGWSGAVSLGRKTGATPDGRRRGESLADCAGPAQGRNTLGLTATLRSMFRLPHRHVHGPLALSLRFPKQTVLGRQGLANLGSLVRTYFRGGGQQLQISIAGTAEMKAAQEDPDAHRSLMVRVGGFSAYFVELDRAFQDDMIARSEMAV